MVTLSGGKGLENALKKIAVKVKNAATVRVGFLEGGVYPDGVTSVPLVAATLEYGTSKMPPRPFFRDMISENSEEWPEEIADLLIKNDFDAKITLTQVGGTISGQLKDKITTYVGPGLAPSTIKRKGFAKELIDTSHMVKSVAYEVD